MLAVKGAWAQARAAFEAVISDLTRVVGSEHPWTRAVGAEHPWTRAVVEELQRRQQSHEPTADGGHCLGAFRRLRVPNFEE